MATDINNIGKLRSYFDELEKDWTAQDEQYLGMFNDQGIAVFVDGGGYAPAVITMDVDGTLIVCAEQHLKPTQSDGNG